MKIDNTETLSALCFTLSILFFAASSLNFRSVESSTQKAKFVGGIIFKSRNNLVPLLTFFSWSTLDLFLEFSSIIAANLVSRAVFILALLWMFHFVLQVLHQLLYSLHPLSDAHVTSLSISWLNKQESQQQSPEESKILQVFF